MIDAFLAVFYASLTYFTVVIAKEEKNLNMIIIYGMVATFAYTCYHFVSIFLY